MKKALAAVIVAVGIVVPAFAFAQTAGNGLLSVYVQVVSPTGSYYYPYYQSQTRTAADFQVQVSGNNPSPSTFWGSQNGVQVSLNPGTYSVAATGNLYGYTASYSQGCNSTMAAGATALCVITVSPNYSGNYPYPSAYPFPYQQPYLRCEPSQQTVGLRQNVSFSIVGGVGGTYNWRAGGRDYPNAGPVLTVNFEQTGSQLVTVTNANLTATCTVMVTNVYNPVVPGPVYPTYPNPGYPTQPTITPTYYPSWPNTGVEPLSAAQVALALALLGAAGAVAAPYARKALAIVTR